MKTNENEVINLRKEIRKYIKKNYRVSSLYFPILEEFIFRRAIFFRFDIDRVKLDLEKGAKYLQYIGTEKFPKEMENSLGAYLSNCNSILFNKDRIKEFDNPFNALVVLSHEFGHVLFYDEDEKGDKYDILEARCIRDENGKIQDINTINSEDGLNNMFLVELIVSRISEIILTDNNEKSWISRLLNSSNTNGYFQMSPIIEMLETAYGVGEREFLFHAVNGREPLAALLSKKTGMDMEKAYDKLDEIESKYCVMHTLLWIMPLDGIDSLTIYNNFGKSFSDLFTICSGLINERIKHKEINSIKEAEEFVEQLKYEYNRLVFLCNKFIGLVEPFTKTLIPFDYQVNPFYIDFFGEIKNEQIKIVDKIEGLEEVLNNNSNGLSISETLQQFNKKRMTDYKGTILTHRDLKEFAFSVRQETYDRNRDIGMIWDEKKTAKIANIAIDLINPNYIFIKFINSIKKAKIFRKEKHKLLGTGSDNTNDYLYENSFCQAVINSIQKNKPVEWGDTERLARNGDTVRLVGNGDTVKLAENVNTAWSNDSEGTQKLSSHQKFANKLNPDNGFYSYSNNTYPEDGYKPGNPRNPINRDSETIYDN